MLSSLEIAVGALCVALVFVDAFMTTVNVSAGAGPLTRTVLAWCWRGLLGLHRQNARSTPLASGGTLLLTATVVAWVALLWVGWGLVFLGAHTVVDSTTLRPAGVGDVAYFSGFTVFTLGTGDYVASAAVWRVVTALASFSGLFLVTLAITYLVSVVSAVVGRRALAIQIHALGATPQEIALQGWDGTAFSSMFEQQLINLTPAVATSAQQHLAYPVLHYFHAREPYLSAPLAVASLDEALLVLAAGVDADGRPSPSSVDPLRYALHRYVDATTEIGSLPRVEAPPAADRDRLAAAGVPLTPVEDFEKAAREHERQRRLLHRLVVSDGWSWDVPLRG